MNKLINQVQEIRKQEIKGSLQHSLIVYLILEKN